MKLGPVIYYVKYPLLSIMWHVPHINKINLHIEKIAMLPYSTAL